MGKIRVTQHNGRIRKGGQPYSPKHNDRNFDVSKADNIDPSRTPLNRYWAIGSKKWYGPDDDKPTFEDVERDYYEKHFMAMYEASRERSRIRGQLKRVKPFEEWRKAWQYVPEETCLQIGSVADGTVDRKTFSACVGDYTKALNAWNNKHGRPFTILDVAYHFDEATPHAQYRRVWHSINPETGIDEIGQEKALERAGVALPDPEKPVSKDNNRKMTFDREMREKWLEICEKHGLDIEKIPEPGRKHNQTKEEYITDKQQARQEELDGREAAIVAAEEQAQTANKAYADTYFATSELERKKAALESEIDDMAEYRAWKAAKAAREAQEAQEAARREQAEQEARKRQEAAQKAREAQERERQEQAARIAAQDAQSSPESEPPKTGGLMAALLSRVQQAAGRNAGKSGPEYPGF